jgi:hypothetical protein
VQRQWAGQLGLQFLEAGVGVSQTMCQHGLQVRQRSGVAVQTSSGVVQ